VDNAVLQRQIPVLVLLDAQMPGTDGFSLIERVRQSAPLVGSVAIMLTSAGLRGDAARCRELGIGAYLSKPPAGRNGRLNLKTAADPRTAGYHRKCSP
jgi:CheY-like chemotaxis protein